jgi:hypothetical protein
MLMDEGKPVELLYDVATACRLLGDISVAQFYILAGRRAFRVVKLGRRTMAEGTSLRDYVASLPEAIITTGRARTDAGPSSGTRRREHGGQIIRRT